MLKNICYIAIFLLATCHGKPFKLNERIIGGSDAPNGSAPYLATLRYNTNEHFCGGSIITPHTILTASHCIFGLAAFRTFAVVGTNTLDAGGIRYQVSSFRIHPAFDPNKLTNDVGLVIIDAEIVFNDRVHPIEMYTEELGHGLPVTLNGWGSVEFLQGNSNDLQTIDLQTISMEMCYEYLNWIFPILESQICTLTVDREGACFGDSGSSLLFQGRVAGIVSWGVPCGVGYPDVYTRTNSFIPWIEENKV
ncbi:chymotrypsin-1-like [Arctopsyche grandis]|uniref:chymotrypsin-1-like n=1 Tax=Arctopsyche grandis TaxID=121162 RepID=UPI00406D8F1F